MDKLKEFEPIFYPKSIAVVGVSTDEQRPGSMYLDNLLRVGFKGKLYGVNPRGGKLLGLDVYPNLRSIPEPIDYVIAAISKHRMLDLLDDCKAKGVKVLHIFTGGYSETGEEGRRLETELVRKARDIGIRIIGPNCAGTSVPSNYTPLGPVREVAILGKAGQVAFISQSGGNAWFLSEVGRLRGIWFSKIISFGNAADLDSVDFLEYLAIDPETKVIGAYLEGTKDGRRLFRTIKETLKVKPLVIWKAGRTEAGAQTAASHTGALAGSDIIWTVALKQAGATQVESLEGLADSLLAFQDLPINSLMIKLCRFLSRKLLA